MRPQLLVGKSLMWEPYPSRLGQAMLETLGSCRDAPRSIAGERCALGLHDRIGIHVTPILVYTRIGIMSSSDVGHSSCAKVCLPCMRSQGRQNAC